MNTEKSNVEEFEQELEPTLFDFGVVVCFISFIQSMAILAMVFLNLGLIAGPIVLLIFCVATYYNLSVFIPLYEEKKKEILKNA